MNTRTRKAVLAISMVSLAGAAVGFTSSTQQSDDEKIVKLAELPDSIQRLIRKHAQGGTIQQIELESEDGTLIYDIEVEKDGEDFEFEVSADGEYLGMDDEDEGGENELDNDEDDDDDGDDDEQTFQIDFSVVPHSVRTSFKKLTNDAKPTLVERVVDEDITVYEIEYALNGGTASMTLTDQGKVMEMEAPVETKDIPQAVLNEIMKDYPGASIEAAESVQLFYYEIEVEVDGRNIEIVAFASGDLEDENDDDEIEDDDHDEHGHSRDHEDDDEEEDDD